MNNKQLKEANKYVQEIKDSDFYADNDEQYYDKLLNYEYSAFNEIVDETYELCNARAKNSQELKNLNKALSEVEKKISNYLKAIEMGIFNEETQNAMNDLIVKKNDYLEKIAIAKAQSARSFTKEEIIKYLDSFKKLDYNNPAEIKYLFNVFLKNVIVADGGEIIIICNTISSNNEKTKPLNYKRFGYQSNGGAKGLLVDYQGFLYYQMNYYYCHSNPLLYYQLGQICYYYLLDIV